MVIRILQILDSDRPDAGSIAASLHGQQTALAALDVESVVASANGSNHQLDWRGSFDTFDAVHVFGWGYPLASQVIALAMQARKPYVLTPVGALCARSDARPTLGSRIRSMLGDRRKIRGACAITTFNERENRELRSKLLADNIVDLPCGLAVAEFTQEQTAAPSIPKLAEGRTILILAPVHPAEGLVLFLKAFAELGTDGDGWNVVIAGPTEGDWRNMLAAAVKRKGGVDRVVFLEAPNLPTQRALVARASILAAPSLYVRCPVSILQALAMGVPVIATHLVAPNGLGDLLRACAPTKSEFKSALLATISLTDPERDDWNTRAIRLCQERFDWSVVAKSYANLYQQVTRKQTV